MACLYTIQEIAGKGRGVLAATSITKGTRIISEPPLFRVFRGGSSKEQLHEAILKTIADLNGEQRQQFLALHNAFDDESGPELGRVRTNALPLGSDAIEGGIFLDSSRINHSCIQNAQNTWNEDLQKLTIHALRDISEGEEITIFYLTDRPNRQARSEALLSSFRFTCSCSLCSLPTNERHKSDTNLDEIKRLDELIGDGMTIFSAPLQALHNVRKLLALLDNEGFADASVPRAYYDAFQIAITHGDMARASIFAERAASNRIMERYAKDPSEHSAYGYTGKWRTEMVDIPSGLDKDAYEGWLWKEEQNLPGDNDINMEYLGIIDGFHYSPIKHWCFLGEIIEVETIFRLRLIVKDKANHRVPIAFHTDEGGQELDQALLQHGYTVAILYAEHHGFLDMTEGIRHEVPSNIKIFPLPSRMPREMKTIAPPRPGFWWADSFSAP
ncbi:SET domain-containing protein [Lindgomyces ingoldianus]|uniref:SET domain-containing protein n=1 Tax=Lindgomyces ingoldianus TaxID=673940 RepID=A0ACB6RDW5_9PLEO|nr:SET domain-containing protein [Lindgomyces ingoldianus]KAF2477434.1 SET domain-containing protein [Lindgomyces ingoldianus]